MADGTGVSNLLLNTGDPDSDLITEDGGLLLLVEEEVESPPNLPGEIDAIGGPLGGPFADRIYLIDSPALGSPNADLGPINGEWLAVGSYPVGGSMLPMPTGAPAIDPFDFRLASRDWASRRDDPDEPSLFWEGRVIDPGNIAMTLPLVPVGDAAVQTNFGQIVVENTDGALDTILDTNLAVSQAIEIKAGTIGRYTRDFVTLCVARITGVSMTRSELTIDIRDPATYARNLYPTTVYTGGGGASGPAELEGTVKPVVLGRVWNMSPVLIDPVRLIYQAHDGPLALVSGVFDGGVALSFVGNHASYAALSSATVSPGSYATCLSAGMIRVGSTPVFAITAHLDGHAPAGNTTRSIAVWLAGQLQTVLGISVDQGSFSTIPDRIAGWLWQEEFSFSDALSRFSGDAGCHWFCNPISGRIEALRLDPPDPSESGIRTLDASDILPGGDIERLSLPEGFNGVHHRRVIRYGRNWTLQTGQLAATAVNAPARQREWKSAIGSRVVGSRNAIDPPVLDTSLGDLAGAEGLAEHMLELHGEHRRIFGIDLHLHGDAPRLGKTVRVSYPRFGLSAGDYFRIIDINFGLSNSSARLLLWG